MTTYDPHRGLPDPATKPEFYAGVPTKRALAWLLDVLLMVILAAAVFILTVIPVVLGFMGIFLFPALLTVFGFLYRWMTLAGGSATWGMRLMAIEIRDQDGARLSSGTAFLHTLGYTICVSTGVLQFASILFMLLTDRKQGLTDLVLNTAAINRPA